MKKRGTICSLLARRANDKTISLPKPRHNAKISCHRTARILAAAAAAAAAAAIPQPMSLSVTTRRRVS
jgi:hypothetical protein